MAYRYRKPREWYGMLEWHCLLGKGNLKEGKKKKKKKTIEEISRKMEHI